MFDRAGADGTFVHTFSTPLNATNDAPRFDFADYYAAGSSAT